MHESTKNTIIFLAVLCMYICVSVLVCSFLLIIRFNILLDKLFEW